MTELKANKMTKQPLTFWAGKKAYEKIRRYGLSAEDVQVMAGAAGGPKWLVLNRLDRAIFGNWLAARKDPLFLAGASIGAWRFAAACQKDPVASIARFEKAYMQQAYPDNPPPEIIDAELERILDELLGRDGPEQILSNPAFRLSILAVRCRKMTGTDRKSRLIPGLGLAAAANAVSRRGLGLFFERTLFYDSRQRPPFFRMNGFPIRRVVLDKSNLKAALMASGSIPMLMSGIKDIPGAPAGMYRDGGILDYHLNIDLQPGGEGIVLFPHYAEKLVPGWLDKQVFWRRPDFSLMDKVLMIAPSADFVTRLPMGKIADRNDFYTFARQDDKRMDCWRQVVDQGRHLAEDFMEAVETGTIRQRVQPISDLYRR